MMWVVSLYGCCYCCSAFTTTRPAVVSLLLRQNNSQNHPLCNSNNVIKIRRRQQSYERSLNILCAAEKSTSSSEEGTDNNDNDNDNNIDVEVVVNNIWMPQLRKIMGGIATLGVLETGYLSYVKFFMDSGPAFCGASTTAGGAEATTTTCQSVLTGPYSTIPYTNIPLATLGLVAYLTVVYLALSPLLSLQSQSTTTTTESSNNKANSIDYTDDTDNRILLSAVTTTMGTFSIFLMTILFGVLHTNCPYCIFSAACSIVLAQLAWIGGCLPQQKQEQESKSKSNNTMSSSFAVGSSFTVATAAAILLYFSVGGSGLSSPLGDNTDSNTLLASIDSSTTVVSNNQQQSTTKTKLFSPPAITADSSTKAIQVGKTLQSLDAKMYGAYWCSHCYDQKQILGKQVFEKNYVQYVECSKDGVDSQTKLCKSKDVPGYPTWEIKGNLFPGQVDLDELQDIINSVL